MDDKVSIFNIYCDESRVENPDSGKMVIGSVILPREEKPRIVEEIKRIYKKYNISFELKWVKARNLHQDFYKEIVDIFLLEESLRFRCIIVDKKNLNLEKYHEGDLELAFFKFYYLMLRHQLEGKSNYYIFLDKKPTRDKNRARALHFYLKSYVLGKKNKCTIEHLQAYDSGDNLLIQLCDFFTGLVGHACNREQETDFKWELITYLRTKINRADLCQSTDVNEKKFNIFYWEGGQA